MIRRLSRAEAQARSDKAFDTVRAHGARDFFEGLPRSSCPYADRLNSRGCVTFSRCWRNAWLFGYDRAAGDYGRSAAVRARKEYRASRAAERRR